MMHVSTTRSSIALIQRFNRTSRVWKTFQGGVAIHDKQWRGKDWSKSSSPAHDPFWLYKATDCVREWLDLEFEIEQSYKKAMACRSAKQLIHGAAYCVSCFYKGVWAMEVCIAGLYQPDLSDRTQDVIFNLLDRLDRLSQTNANRRAVSNELMINLLDICLTARQYYSALACALDPADHEEFLRRTSRH